MLQTELLLNLGATRVEVLVQIPLKTSPWPRGQEPAFIQGTCFHSGLVLESSALSFIKKFHLSLY